VGLPARVYSFNFFFPVAFIISLLKIFLLAINYIVKLYSLGSKTDTTEAVVIRAIARYTCRDGLISCTLLRHSEIPV
jgi:hypothetical protein